MKGIKIIFFLIALFAVGAIGFYATNLIINGNEAEGKSMADQVKQNQSNVAKARPNVEGMKSELTKSNSEGAVAIKTTLLPEKSSGGQLVFEVVMNTHSVDLLRYDLSQLASISFGADINNTGTFEWLPTNKDSHHMMGNLTWNGTLDKNYKNIDLEIIKIDNIPSRKFTWGKSKAIDEILSN
ncbi:hypothetical protein [Neobacillus sp. SAB-20_R2A]|uniref:hypothetical protein n=1 Tax=Neobacillus sp. SAB-20_R2A TaxID=3120519 RepID=UPI003C6E17C8